VAKIRDQLGDIDILVNYAGLVKNNAPLSKMTIEEWQHEISVNLSGAYYMIRQVIGPMVEKGWGLIINMSSIAAKGGLHMQIGYASSKAGLLGLTQTVTLEHARHGITCNAIKPGLIGTEVVDIMPSQIRQTIIAGIPARRRVEMEEVGHLIAFLASDRAGFINGAVIPIDGGATLNMCTLGSRKELRETEAMAKG
jgi:NAD(P)-dependent dehydrogenase (short-subunit alcohol dehydrogenase family)